MRFVKMHGIGNDYVYVDLFANPDLPGEPADLAIKVSDRHFGIGSDGLILVGPSETADVRMRMFNADGSESQICGNGIRCVAKLAFDAGHVKGRRITVETRAGIKTLDLTIAGGKVSAVRVNMGPPTLAPAEIPVKLPGERAIGVPISLNGRRFDMTCVSMGNPHAVFFCESLDAIDLNLYGPTIERHPMFPERVNAHFVRVHSRSEVTMKTWERGSGITLACGTGASAVCVAAVLNKRTDRKIVAHLPGGDLSLEWDEASNDVFMTGPAVEVFRGEWQGR
ncbi:MAG: diaminopimelate epimerase [Phycisphaerae bacterium]|nr:diaminopimelate epimerase [Phycisphaerae bacterium]